MTQTVTVQSVQDLAVMKVAELKNLVATFKEEDTDCLSEITSKATKAELIAALASHMNLEEVAEDVAAEVENQITEAVEETDLFSIEAMDNDIAALLGETTEINEMEAPVVEEPVAEETPQAVIEPEVLQLSGEMAEVEIEPPNPVSEVDALMAELDLPTEVNLEAFTEETAPPKEKKAKKAKEPKEPKAKRVTIPMDAPIPVRQFQNLILGIYGNILEELEEPDEATGYKYEELKLERFNPKAHETFRNTKGNMHLLYTQNGGTYLIAHKQTDGTYEPILEVTNKGRAHLRCTQIANALQLAYNKKDDQTVITAEDYIEMTSKIELMPINGDSVGA